MPNDTNIAPVVIPDVITYGAEPNAFTFSWRTLPETSIYALIRSGIAHKMGNEVASKVSALNDARTEDKSEGALGPMNDAEKAVVKLDAQKAMFEAILAGTVGVRSGGGGGTRVVDPVGRALRELATAEVLAVLKHNGLSRPKKDEKVTFGDGNAFTMEELLGRRIGHPTHGPRLQHEAEAKVKADERAARKRDELIAGGANDY